ncbi:MAG: gluconokinase [Thermomicrobiales bacterium]
MPVVPASEALAPFVLAIDAGTSSVRALVFDRRGNAVEHAEAQLPYRIDTTPDGGATFDADALLALTIETIDRLQQAAGEVLAQVEAVGVTSFWHSLLGLDHGGKPCTPVYYWADTRSAPDALALRGVLDAHAVWQRTGCRLHPSYWPAKLHWLQRTEPTLVAQVARWVSFPEYALGLLCEPAVAAVTLCMASGTGLLDVHHLQWDAELLHLLGLKPENLSPLTNLGPPGPLRPVFLQRWPALRGAQWYPALGDGACANVGCNAIGPGRMALTVGTSAAMRMILPREHGAAWDVPHGLWAYRLDAEYAVLGGALSNGGNFLRWLRETTNSPLEAGAMAEAAALPAAASGITMLPFVAGERSPSWHDNATAVFFGLTQATTPADLLRAGMEAVAYRLAAIYDHLAPLADDEFQILVNGGAIVDSPPWLQIIADVLGHPLIPGDPGSETTARGAAMLAAVESGISTITDWDQTSQTAGAVYVPQPADFPAYQKGRQAQESLEQVLTVWGAFA